MKKYITLGCLFISSLALSQTIDNSWFPKIGTSYDHVVNLDDSNADFTEPTFGLNQTWDFSAVSETPFLDEVSFLDPIESRFSESYPESNLLRRVENQFNFWEWFYRVEQDTIYEEGFAVVALLSNDTSQVIREPNENIYMVNGFSAGDSLWRADDFFMQHIFVGTGNVITPDTTYDNCILLKEEAPNVGAGDFTYRWFHENLSKEVLVFIPEESDHPFPVVQYLINLEEEEGEIETLTQDLNDVSSLEIQFVNNQLMINNQNNNVDSELMLFDIGGNMLHKEDVFLFNGENSVNLSHLHGLVSGTYPLLILEKGSGNFSSHKLMILD